MARKSGWQEFADNFNSTYGTFKKIGMDYETAELMDDEKFKTGLGKGLEGTELERARYKALGDIYTKYGDAKSGLAVRTQLAGLEKADRDNNLQRKIFDELVDQRGVLTSNKMRADTSLAKANTGLANANTAYKFSQTDTENKMRDGKVLKQNLENQGLNLGNLVAQSNALVTAGQNSQVLSEIDLVKKIADLDFRKKNNITTPEQAQEFYLASLDNLNIPIERKIAVRDMVQKHTLGKLTNQASLLTQQGKARMSKGLGDFVSWFDTVDDGDGKTTGPSTLSLTENPDGTVKVTQTTGNKTVVLQEGPRNEVEAFMMAQIENPGTALTVASQVLTNKKLAAEISGTTARTEYQAILTDTARYAALIKNDNTQAQTDLAKAQAEKLKQEVDQEDGLTWNDKQAQKAFGSFLSGNTYATLSVNLQNEPDKLRLYTNRVKFGLGLIKKPPASFRDSEEVWLQMTDDDRSLFR